MDQLEPAETAASLPPGVTCFDRTSRRGSPGDRGPEWEAEAEFRHCQSGALVYSPCLEDAIAQEGCQREDLDHERACGNFVGASQLGDRLVVRVPEAVEFVGETTVNLGYVITD
jgi:hypothetical protein